MPPEATIAQNGPFQVALVEGKAYFYCTCGLSKAQPFCDGGHAGTAFLPKRFVATETGTANLCGCKTTDDPPFCDGSHNVL